MVAFIITTSLPFLDDFLGDDERVPRWQLLLETHVIESVSSTCVLHSQICRNNCAMNTLGKRVSITLGLQGFFLKTRFPNC